MIDARYNCKRYIAEFSEETEELLAKYDLSSFDLASFQLEFGESDSSNPMFDCYQINKENVAFIKRHLKEEPNWDFINKSYFVEASSI